MLAELLKETNLEVYLRYFQRDAKPFKIIRIIYGLLFLMFFATSALLFENYLLLIGSPIVAIIGYKFPYLNLILRKEKQNLIVSFLFPEFLQSFMALLSSSGNVYQTLVASVPHVGEPIKSELEKLIRNIEKENKREYYLEFAEYIGTSEAYMILDLIYQFSEFGIKKDALQQIEQYIQSIVENKTEELIEKKMSVMDVLSFPPLLISLVLVFGFAVVLFLYYMQDVSDVLKVVS